MSKYQAIIFDWDGTLMDSAPKIVACMQQAAILAELPVPSDDDVRHIIGISLIPAIEQLFQITDENTVFQVRDFYKEVFIQQDTTPSPLFKGVKNLLGDLKANHKILTVATGKARRGLERAWQQTQTKHYFQTSRCADEAESKPSPDMLQQILSELDIDVSQAVMVGDTSYDMSMAEQIGMDRIAVTFGAHSEDKLSVHRPSAFVDDIDRLIDHLL